MHFAHTQNFLKKKKNIIERQKVCTKNIITEKNYMSKLYCGNFIFDDAWIISIWGNMKMWKFFAINIFFTQSTLATLSLYPLSSYIKVPYDLPFLYKSRRKIVCSINPFLISSLDTSRLRHGNFLIVRLIFFKLLIIKDMQNLIIYSSICIINLYN